MSGEFSLRIKKIKEILDENKMASQAFQVFYKNTPVKSGNARRNTGYSQNAIEAKYPYAKRLDEGYSSQSPKGMTEPTIKFLQDYIKKNLGK